MVVPPDPGRTVNPARTARAAMTNRNFARSAPPKSTSACLPPQVPSAVPKTWSANPWGDAIAMLQRWRKLAKVHCRQNQFRPSVSRLALIPLTLMQRSADRWCATGNAISAIGSSPAELRWQSGQLAAGAGGWSPAPKSGRNDSRIWNWPSGRVRQAWLLLQRRLL